MANINQEQIELAKLQEQLKVLQAENARLQAEKASVTEPRITIKCAEFGRGSVSVYGFQRFPISLYPSAWLKLLGDTGKKVSEFIKDNPNILRAYAYAHEYACAAMGIKTEPAKDAADRKRFEDLWTEGKSKALLDPSLQATGR